jgi:hypothetical protein
MRRHVDFAHLVDEVGGVIGLVGSDGARPLWRKPPMGTEHRRGGLAFGKAIGHL